MRRKITGWLEEWLESGRMTCPVIKGGRRVGKTYSVTEFGRSRFEHFVHIDFSRNDAARSAFNGALDPDTVVRNLTTIFTDTRFVPGRTLLFFDEIQECPRARASLKYFAEDGRYRVIASSSLPKLGLKEIPMVPVGYAEDVRMNPMDFEEFLWAIGVSDEVISYAKNRIGSTEPLGEPVLGTLMRYTSWYMIVGGMPEAVLGFSKDLKFDGVRDIQRKILDGYLEDIENYSDKVHKTRTKACFESIPSMLSKKNKRFMYSEVENGSKPGYRIGTRYYGYSLDWLDMASVAMFCNNVTGPEEPLVERVVQSEFKLYLSDIGLLTAAYPPSLMAEIAGGNLDVNKGALSENLVACMLHAQGRPLMYYARNRPDGDRMGLDLVLETGSGIVAVEVKSGSNRRCASMNKAVASGTVGGIMFETRDIFTDGKGVRHYPLFAAAFMDSIDPPRIPTADRGSVTALNEMFRKGAHERRRPSADYAEIGLGPLEGRIPRGRVGQGSDGLDGEGRDGRRDHERLRHPVPSVQRRIEPRAVVVARAGDVHGPLGLDQRDLQGLVPDPRRASFITVGAHDERRPGVQDVAQAEVPAERLGLELVAEQGVGHGQRPLH